MNCTVPYVNNDASRVRPIVNWKHSMVPIYSQKVTNRQLPYPKQEPETPAAQFALVSFDWSQCLQLQQFLRQLSLLRLPVLLQRIGVGRQQCTILWMQSELVQK